MEEGQCEDVEGRPCQEGEDEDNTGSPYEEGEDEKFQCSEFTAADGIALIDVSGRLLSSII
jgi:hypothetical protein